MVGSGEELPAGRNRVTVLTSVVLLVIAAGAWVTVIQSSRRGDDMMMTMPMPATAADGFAFVVELGHHDDRDDAAERAPDDLAVRRDSAGCGQRGRERTARRGVHRRLPSPVGRERGPGLFRPYPPDAASRVRVRLRGRGDLAGGGGVPALAPQAGVPPRVSEPAGLSPRPLARGPPGQPCARLVACGVLSWMLLGAHAGARRRRRDGSPVGAPHHGRGGGREAAPGRTNGSRGPPARPSCFSASRWHSVPIS